MMAATTVAARASVIVGLEELGDELAAAIVRAVATGGRVVLVRDGQPIATVLAIDDAARLDRFDAERDADFAVFSEISDAFGDVDPEDVEREAALARAEMRVERAAGIRL